jgi:hypothetical protein
MKEPRRWIAAFDNHGDMEDAETRTALMAFKRDWKPHIRIHGGDNWDFRNLRKGASDDEKSASLGDDWEAGSDYLADLFAGEGENIFLRGNHDERLWNLSKSATGILRDYAEDGIKRIEGIVRKVRAKMLPYDSTEGIYQIGKLTVIHGYFHGVNACRQHANTYGNCIFGHIHEDSSAPVPSLKAASADAIPCVCIRNMDYVNQKTAKMRWSQGWAYGLLFDDGTYTLNKVRKIDGRFHCATSFKAY